MKMMISLEGFLFEIVSIQVFNLEADPRVSVQYLHPRNGVVPLLMTQIELQKNLVWWGL